MSRIFSRHLSELPMGILRCREKMLKLGGLQLLDSAQAEGLVHIWQSFLLVGTQGCEFPTVFARQFIEESVNGFAALPDAPRALSRGQVKMCQASSGVDSGNLWSFSVLFPLLWSDWWLGAGGWGFAGCFKLATHHKCRASHRQQTHPHIQNSK